METSAIFSSNNTIFYRCRLLYFRRITFEVKRLFNLFKQDYRHVICFVITFISIELGFLFPNAIPRLLESLRDLVTSIFYYCIEIFVDGANPIAPTVTNLQNWRIAPEIWEPIKLFPSSLEEFFSFWARYFELVFTKEYIIAYFRFIGDFFYYGSRILLALMPLVLVVWLKIKQCKNKYVTERNKKSKPLITFEKFYFKVVFNVIGWCKDFIDFCRDNFGYVKVWLLLFAVYFNVFSIIISAIAYYLYFVSSWNVFSLYTQILKAQVDLTPVIRFIPGIIWLTVAYLIYNHYCRSLAFQRLYYAERCNRAFLRDRGIVTVVFGAMGTGKTQLITAMARSAEIEMYDQAYKIMLEKDLMFPNFPWQVFRDRLKKQIDDRKVVDLESCEKWVRGREQNFAYLFNKYSLDEYKEMLARYPGMRDITCGYDIEHYAMTYNDELKISTLFDALVAYAQAYMLFTVQTTLIFSNYSIRVDSIIDDIGNFPIRNSDFFHREPKLIEAHQKHSHIIDFDMLRLGRKLQHTLKLSPGVYVVTEIDKERKNALELKEYKIKDDETNQKNDLFNACLMMCRHAAIIDNKVFIRIICDLQRPEAWGAGGRELGEVIYIADKGNLEPVLPFFSPYWIFQGIFEWIRSKWDDFYSVYIVNRSDMTLFVYIAKNIIAKISNYYDKQNGLFGKQTLRLEIQSGTLEGAVKTDKWHILTKKDRSNVYRTDCLNSVFDLSEPNTMHIDDFICYAGSLATQDETAKQNSFFQNDIRKMKGMK